MTIKEPLDMNGKYIKIGDYLYHVDGGLYQCRLFSAHGLVHAVNIANPTISLYRPASEFCVLFGKSDGKSSEENPVDKNKLLELADMLDEAANHNKDIPLWLVAIKIRGIVHGVSIVKEES